MAKFDMKTIRPPDKPITDPREKKQDMLDTRWNDWNSTQSPMNMQVLLDEADPVLRSAVRSYTGMTDHPILYGKARLMAAQAMPKFDPKQKVKLKTFLMNELKGLTRFGLQDARPIRTPERIIYDSRTLDKAEREYQVTHLREPSIAELADSTGLSQKRIEHVRTTIGRTLNEGTMAQVGREGAPFEVPTNRPDPLEIIKDFVYHDLNDVDKIIFDYRFGAHGKPRTGVVEIGRKLKISPSSVSNRAATIADKIASLEQYNV